jgi:hypothetical protein
MTEPSVWSADDQGVRDSTSPGRIDDLFPAYSHTLSG